MHAHKNKCDIAENKLTAYLYNFVFSLKKDLTERQ